jgi:cation diffusion facilitator family transporter
VSAPAPTVTPHAHDHADGHDHTGPGWFRSALHLVRPHSHDPADRTDAALESAADGIRAVKISLVALTLTAVAQGAVFLLSGSVALLADSIHNVSDGLTALPLWLAFALARRPPTRRYTYGLGRVEDLAGMFIVLTIGASALVAGWESLQRLDHPQAVHQLAAVAGAGVIGFIGNEAVAGYRIGVGRRIGSAALVADGRHARADGFTSLGVVAGAAGVAAGWPQADPVVGLAITAAILVVLVGAVRDVGRRLLDGVDPGLVATAEAALSAAPGVRAVQDLRLRWLGHRLLAEAVVALDPTLDLVATQRVVQDAADAVRARVPQLDRIAVLPIPATAP